MWGTLVNLSKFFEMRSYPDECHCQNFIISKIKMLSIIYSAILKNTERSSAFPGGGAFKAKNFRAAHLPYPGIASFQSAFPGGGPFKAKNLRALPFFIYWVDAANEFACGQTQ